MLSHGRTQRVCHWIEPAWLVFAYTHDGGPDPCEDPHELECPQDMLVSDLELLAEVPSRHCQLDLAMFLLDKIFLGGKFWGADRKNRRENRTTHTTKFVVHFLLPYRIGLRFVPYCCIRQASRLLLELREREIQRASGQRAL